MDPLSCCPFPPECTLQPSFVCQRASSETQAKAISQLIDALKLELEAYIRANYVLPEENQTSLAWR